MPIQHVDKQKGEDGEDEYSVSEAAEPSPWEKDATFQIIGRPHARLEGPEKVTGRAHYTYDIRQPGMLYAKVLRSPHPHAHKPHGGVEQLAFLVPIDIGGIG